jgi:glycosyltransferase involved in cell wall biosynthesis
MLISLIIPMYNSEKTITRCLDSVFKQSFKSEMEIIVVNDGSSDSSSDIVSEYSNLNNRFNIILINQENGGVSKARNTGMKLANGDYIALLDSDDEWFPEKLEKQLEVFESDNAISFIGGLIFKPSLINQKIIEIPLSRLIFKNFFQPSTVIFKKDIIDKVGFFDESQKYAEEGNYFMRIAKEFKCVLLNEQLVNYSQGKIGFGVSGLSANLKEMEKGELRNLKFAYQQNYISFFTYLIAFTYSILKYIRRILIVKFR